MNLEPVSVADCNNYTNLEFSESLCLYENAKHVLSKAGVQAGDDACDKCGGHKKQQRCAENGGGDEKSSGDYMTMEPVNGRMAAQPAQPRGSPFPGYLPMCPAGGANGCNKQQDMLKNIMNKGLAGKSVSIPSLNEQHKRSAAASDGGGGNDDDDVPVLRNKDLDGGLDEPRKRSSSAGSSSRHDGSEQLQRALQYDDVTTSLSAESVVTDKTCAATASCSGAQSDDSGCSGTVRDDRQTALVHIRRSSSVPCKNNRDSSSSNDSGVSTGSLRYRGADFAEFELPLTTAMSTVRHRRVAVAADPGRSHRRPDASCVHGSLPRRSKSIDRLKDLGGGGFRFLKCAGPVKSSSAGAEVPVCLKKDDKGQWCQAVRGTLGG